MKLINKIFNESYYQIKSFEKNGKFYEYVGIKFFKKLLLYQTKNKRDKSSIRNYHLQKYSINGLYEFEKISKNSERSHVILAVFMLAGSVLLFLDVDSNIDIVTIVLLNLINIFTNIYPIMLLRYNRIRIYRILNKTNLKKGHQTK
jgi:hypothetical protein